MESTSPRRKSSVTQDLSSNMAYLRLIILVPGLPQFFAKNNDRAWVLIGSYGLALLVGIFSWGTTEGLAMLAFAFATHVFSAVDAIGKHTFPGFGRFVPTFTISASLGAFCYAPALMTALIFAWPIALDELPRECYLVNRLAYYGNDPIAGETVWLRPARVSRPRMARVIAGSGQRVEWSGNQFLSDGMTAKASPFRVAGSPLRFKMIIPQQHLLISFGSEPNQGNAMEGAWEIVNRSDVQGRAWARSYPILDRRFLR